MPSRPMKKRASMKIQTKMTLADTSSSRTRMVRAVASSTAIETGQPVRDIEQRLSTPSRKIRKVELA